MPDIQLGIALWSQSASWQEFQAAAQLVDRLGYDLLLTNDHLLSEVGPDDQIKFEAWTTLAAWATVTSHAKLAHWVGGNSLRNPAVVAKMATTVDHASNGRVILGIGSGWFEREHAAYGIEFGGGAGERLDWLDEAVGLMRQLFAGETVTHGGEGTGLHYRTEELLLVPRPVHGTIPIMIGGAGEKKTLRIVARYADIWDAAVTPKVEPVKRKIDILAGHCDAVGRDISQIVMGVSPTIYIRDDVAEARRVWDAALHHNGAEPGEDADPWIGPPEAIAERMHPLIELGITQFTPDMPAPYDHETIERWIGEVRPLL